MARLLVKSGEETPVEEARRRREVNHDHDHDGDDNAGDYDNDDDDENGKYQHLLWQQQTNQ